MTQPNRPSADGTRPRIARTNSLFTRSVRAREGGDARAGGLFDVVVNGYDPGTGSWPQYGPFAPRSSDFAGRRASGTVGRTGPVPASVGQASGTVVIPIPGGAGSASRNALDYVPDGYEFVRVVKGGIEVRPASDSVDEAGSERNTREGPENGSNFSDSRDGGRAYSPYSAALQQSIQQKTTSVVGIADPENPMNLGSLQGILESLPADVAQQTFLFDRAMPLSIDPETGAPTRTGSLQSRGVYGSADSLERQLPPGETIETGQNENLMTVSAGLMWLRNLAARDRAAYNRLVVLLRNAGYPGLSADDSELPLNGYTDVVGGAFALAAADLVSASLGGDNRTLMEYLQDRGQGYADMLAQQEADAAAEAAYQPIERRYQDPATLRMALEEAAKATLGRKLSDEEEARFEAHFRSMENGLYDNIDNAGRNETAWEGYAPDTTGQAWAFLDDPRYETEEAANRIGGYAQSFMRMMGVGG